MHDETVIAEFTGQAASFNGAAVINAPDILERLVQVAQPRPDQRWLDAACGTGVVARALAPRVREVIGVDATPAMVELAREEAAARGIANVSFTTGDVTALALPEASVDGAMSRFALHHIPAPGRVVAELARVVSPGGAIVVADIAADEDLDAYAWSQEIERLRDPSHWAALTPRRLREVGRAAGLTLEHEELVALALDFEDWLARGSGAVNAAVIEQALTHAPAAATSFAVRSHGGARFLHYPLWVGRWRR